MKKRLKGLVALIMAIAMVISIAPNSLGAISDSDYDNLNEAYMKVIADPRISIADAVEQQGAFDDYYCDFLDYDTAYVGERPLDELWMVPDFYTISGWTIWEVTDCGYVVSESKSKTVSMNYEVTEQDFKEYGLMESTDCAYAPYIEAILTPINITIDIYDAEGNSKTDEVVVNAQNYMSTPLSIPEGYTGYMLYAEYENQDSTDYSDESEVQMAFVADCEDIWTEIVIMNYFNYKPVKLVPVKGIPYYFSPNNNLSGDVSEDYLVYLEPGETIIDNEEIRDRLSDYSYDAEEVSWDVWRINYCGGCYDTSLDNEENNYGFTTTTALSVEDYTDTRKELATEYPDTYYYTSNFLGLSGVGSDVYPYEGPFRIKEYEIPVYNLDGDYLGSDTITKNDLKYYDWEYEEEVKSEIWIDVFSGDCGWKFEYDGVDYGEVIYNQDIWDIAIAGQDYDSSKAKLVVVCYEHNYVKDSVVLQPTANKKGKTKYVCPECGTYKIVEDIDKLITLNSIELKGSLFTYTGSEVKPGFDVKAYVNSQLVTLTPGEDYTVSYSDNVMPGLGTVKVTGKGKYVGTKTATFKIRPKKVKNLKATAGVNKIGLSWSAVTGATGYLVYASAENGEFEYIGSTKTTSYMATGLPDGVEYEYRVAAYVKTPVGNISGEKSDILTEGAKIELDSVTLSKDTFTYTGDYIKPVVKVTAYVNGRKTELTNWTDYKVTYENFKMPGIAKITVTGRGNYYGTLTTTFVIKPNWVTNVSQIVDSTYTKNLRIKWSAVPGVTGYEVYKSTEKLGTYVKVGTVTTTEFISKDLEPGTSYYYKVRAYKTVGSKKIYGNYSNILKATTRTVAPSKPMTKITLLMNNVKWYYSPGAAGYEVYMSNNEKFIGSKIASTTPDVRNISIPGLDTGKTYYVRVRAYTTTATGAKMYTSFSPYASFMAK